MDYLIHTLLNQAKAKLLTDKISSNETYWVEGKNTAGSHAAKVKKNLQLNINSDPAIQSSENVIELIKHDQLLKSYCLPRRIHGVMFSKSSQGDGYGTHVDNAYMNSGRSDLSLLFFLVTPTNIKVVNSAFKPCKVVKKSS